MVYEDSTRAGSGYEETIVFAYNQNPRKTGPKYMTLEFGLTEEMQEDFEGLEVDERQVWIVYNIDYLLEYGLVDEVREHDEIGSADDLIQALEDNEINLDAFYV